MENKNSFKGITKGEAVKSALASAWRKGQHGTDPGKPRQGEPGRREAGSTGGLRAGGGGGGVLCQGIRTLFHRQ